jgi:nucleotide-binding universal stress UspA family protein
MIRISQILCPVDLSDASATAFAYACMLSRWYDAPVTAIQMIWVGVPAMSPAASPFVLTPAQVQDFTHDLDTFVTANTPPGTRRASVVLREGPMVRGILEEARTLGADLIVMGTHGRGGFEHLVLGSVTEKVLRKASIPVLTVPPSVTQVPATVQPFNAVLCAIDFSPASIRALRYAESLAAEGGKRLILVHVIDWVTDRPIPAGLGTEMLAAQRRQEDSALQELRSAVSTDVRAWCTCEEMTAIGRPYEQILKVAEEQHADLIVLGVHGRHAIERALFGSTTNQIVRRAACPVLTVHP